MRMNLESIYYTEDEIKSLIKKQGVDGTAFLSSGINKYGYIKDGEKFYKNIIIENAETGENMSSHFKAPVFDVHRRTLTIEADLNNLPPDYVQIVVTLSKDFHYVNVYEGKGKDIKLNQDKKWLYYVNNRQDVKEPDTVKLQLECSVSGGDKFTPMSSVPHTYDSYKISTLGIESLSPKKGKYVEFDMDFMINDDGVGLKDSFDFEFYKFAENYVLNDDQKNEKYRKWNFNYNMRNLFLADYTGRLTVNSLAGTTELEDGGYVASLIFTDRNGNTSKRNYYIYLDNSISLDDVTAEMKDLESNREVYFNSFPGDLKSLILKLKKNGEEGDDLILIKDGNSCPTINLYDSDGYTYIESNYTHVDIWSLNKSKSYIFTFIAEDYCGNKGTKIFSLSPDGYVTEVVQ